MELSAQHDVLFRQLGNVIRFVSGLQSAISPVCDMLATRPNAILRGFETVEDYSHIDRDRMQGSVYLDVTAAKISIVEWIVLANASPGGQSNHVNTGSLLCR